MKTMHLQYNGIKETTWANDIPETDEEFVSIRKKFSPEISDSQLKEIFFCLLTYGKWQGFIQTAYHRDFLRIEQVSRSFRGIKPKWL